MTHLRDAMLYLTLCGIGSIVNAQTVYRCGPGGHSYSYVPCPEGRAVDVGDRRSVLERQYAQRAAATDRRLASEMERERVAREREPKPNAGSLGMGPRNDDDQPTKAKKPKDFKSKGPAPVKPPKKPPPSAAGTSSTADPSSRRAPG